MNYCDDFYGSSKSGMGGNQSMPYMQMQQIPSMTMQVPMNMPGMNQGMQMGNIPMPNLPTGTPSDLIGPVPGSPQLPGSAGTPSMDMGTPIFPTDDTQFVPGYLRSQIGKLVRVEFLIGTNGPLIDRIGVLLFVGTSYIVLNPIGTKDLLMCDLYSIKFTTSFQEGTMQQYLQSGKIPANAF